ncbi:MAG TPA: hypothetical protein VM509_14390, partial [Planctomycetota bacterium]|nr:hypothetical protein [Planctomycetota bacterium]
MSGGRKKLVLALAVFVASLFLAEIGVRCSTSPAFDSEKALERDRLAVESLEGTRWNPRAEQGAPDAASTGLVLHPYYGFDVATSDALLAKEVETFAKPISTRVIDVLILGGSVAASFTNECVKELHDALDALPGWKERGVRIHGAGRGGFRQPQLLHELEYLLAIGYRPDVVVEIDGFNEVALGVQNARAGVHPILPSTSHWSQVTSNTPRTPRAMDAIVAVREEQRASRRLFERAQSFGLFHSAIGARLAQRSLDQSRKRWSTAVRAYEDELIHAGDKSRVVGPAFETSDDSAVASSAEIWWRSSLEMDAVCRLWGIRYVHLLQPTLHDEGSKPLTANERKNGAEPGSWALGAKLGYP